MKPSDSDARSPPPRAKGISGPIADRTGLPRGSPAPPSGLLYSILAGIGTVVYDQDADLRYTLVHDPQPEVAREAILGKTDHDLLPAASASRLVAIKKRVMETGVAAEEVLRITGGGEEFRLHIFVRPRRDARGRIDGITCSYRDLTGPAGLRDPPGGSAADLQASGADAGGGKAGNGLRQSAKHLNLIRNIERAILAERSPEAIADVGLGLLMKAVPCRRASLTRYDVPAGVGTVLAARGEGETRLGAGQQYSLGPSWMEAMARGEPYIYDDLRAVLDPTPIITALIAEGIHCTLTAPLVVHGEMIGTINLGADTAGAFGRQDLDFLGEVADSLAVVLHTALLLREVSEKTEALDAMAVRMAELEEAERRRLARELHDQVGQALTVLGLNVNLAHDQLPASAYPQVRERLEDALDQVELLAVIVRNVMNELRPDVLDDYGLLAALRLSAERFQKRTGIPATVGGPDPQPRLPPKTETALFRISQEALANVARHARARSVTLVLAPTESGCRLTVADDGVGIDLRQGGRKGRHPGHGLQIMRQRAAAVGGSLSLDSTPGAGTRLVVEVKG